MRHYSEAAGEAAAVAKKDAADSNTNTSSNNPEHVDGRPYGVLLVAGDRHCGLLTDHGTVYTWGCEERGRLGLGDVRSGTGNYVLEPKAVDVNGGKNQWECVGLGGVGVWRMFVVCRDFECENVLTVGKLLLSFD